MERKAIYFNGDVTLLKLNEFLEKIKLKDFGITDIVIGGSLLQEVEDLNKNILAVPVNLWFLDDIENPDAIIKVDGDLYCVGNIDAYHFSVSGDITCEKDVDIAYIESGGDATFEGNVNGNEIKTFGDFTCYGACNSSVMVGGFFICKGDCTEDVKKI